VITGTFRFQCVSCLNWFEAPAVINEPVTVHCPNCHAEYNMQFIPSKKKTMIYKLEVNRATVANQTA
jgi:hypothetical protein